MLPILCRISIWTILSLVFCWECFEATCPQQTGDVKLNLANRSLAEIEHESDTRKPKITMFNLSHNQLPCIENGAFKDYSCLKRLSLQFNQLTTIGETAFCGTKLKRLNLAHNHLSIVPNLNCNDNELQIKILILSHNAIRELEFTSFNGLKQLEELWLENISIHSINPDAFGETALLTHLFVAHNKLTGIDSGTFCGTRLASLNLASNNLTYVPDLSCIGGTLLNLTLDGNLIQKLSRASFVELGKLNILSLENNTIHHIEPDTFSQNSVSKVYIAHNQLVCIQLVSNYNIWCIFQQ